MKCADRVWIVLGFLFCSLGSAGGSLRLAEDNIDEIVRQMSPREKAMLLVGCESLVSKDSLTVYVPGGWVYKVLSAIRHTFDCHGRRSGGSTYFSY